MTRHAHSCNTWQMITIDIPRDSEPVELIPGLHFPSRAIVFDPDPECPHDVYAIVTPDLATGLLVVAQLDVRQRPGGDPVTTASLRKVTVGKLIQACIPYLQVWDSDPVTGNVTRVGTPWLTEEDVKHAELHGPDNQTLRRVAHVYRLALIKSGAPTKSVSAAFNISQATAGRWVTKTRNAGYLGPVQAPGKASA